MKKFTLFLLCALLLVGLMPFGAAAAAQDAPVLESAQMGILYEETTDTILVNFNGDKKNVPASLTKVMTAILVLEQGKVIERGDHEALLEQKGKYYQLYNGMFELD